MDLSKYTLEKFHLDGKPVKPNNLDKTLEVVFEVAINGGTQLGLNVDGKFSEHIYDNNELQKKVVDIVDEWIRSTKECHDYYKARESYNIQKRKHSSELHEQFKRELFEELGILDNPKREELFSKAWELGHSAGYSEVYNYARDLVDLIV